MAKHTPGPWAYQERSDAYTHIVRAGDRFLCQLAQDSTGEAEANARLIAAAPDLLAALKDARAWVAHWQEDVRANLKPTPESLADAHASIRAAIAKAEAE